MAQSLSVQDQEEIGSRKWAALSVVCLGKIMGSLDIAIVNLGMPVFAQRFEADPATVGWISIAYLLVISSLLLTYGRLSDIVGHRKVYLAGFVIFTVSSLLCVFSQTRIQLIAFRVLQALGAGMLMAVGTALVADVFPARERGKALGIISMAVATGTAAGPGLGGILISYWGWQSIFIINVPIGILGVIIGYFVLPQSRSRRAERGFDVAGGVLAAVSLASIVLVLSRGAFWGWTSPQSIGFLGLAIVGGAVFVRTEMRTDQPMLDLSLFRNRLFSAANGAALINFCAVYLMLFLMPFYLMDVQGMGPAQAGLLMMSIPIIQLALSPVSGWLSDRVGSRGLASAGMLVSTIGMLALSLLNPDTSMAWVAARMSIIGVGLSLFYPPNNNAIMGAAPRNRFGIASSVIATVRNVGTVVGVALAVMIVATRQPLHTGILEAQGAQAGSVTSLSLFYSIQDALRLAAVLGVIAAILSLTRGSRTAPREMTRLEETGFR